MTVFANFMKSYTQLPAYFARAAAESVQYGADAIYLVDSAGGMLPEDVRAYIRAAQDVTPEVKLGFHGHNNLGLAMANALVCMEEGVSIIDTSLQGFGRSAGNVSTELFLGLLVRMGLVSEAKLIEAMDIGEQLIQPRITQRGLNSLDVTAGVAQFHSSYMVGILSKSREKGVDPRMLILELCRTNKLDAPDAMVERLANQLAANSVNAKGRSTREWGSYYGDEEKKI
jgi:hypothetical protein